MMNIDGLSDSAERILDGAASVAVWVTIGLLTLAIFAQAAKWAMRG